MAGRGPGATLALFAAFSAGGALLLLVVLEGALALALRLPPEVGPDSFAEARRRYHVHHERAIAQFLPECARPDPRLGYTLRPGRCRFATRVFDTELHVNTIGTRDDEAALVAPAIVVAGDSYAMGWGVAQQETLSARLARATGEKTLNTAISSYGTARELLLLERVDLSAAHTLVVQYCENDYAENVAFASGDGNLRTMDRTGWEAKVAEHRALTRYRPGKHVRYLVPIAWRVWRDAPESAPERSCAQDAAAFLAALRLAPRPPHPLRVVFLEALYGPDHRTCTGEALRARARDGALPAWVSALHVLDTASLLGEDDYLPLDGHWAASGHEKIARAIAGVLAR